MRTGDVLTQDRFHSRQASAQNRFRAGGMSGTGANFASLMSYGVARADVIQFIMSLALQLVEFNINGNCICPDVLYTPLYEYSVPRRINATPGAEE